MMIEIGLGLLVGLVLALTGAGGGILTVPLLKKYPHDTRRVFG